MGWIRKSISAATWASPFPGAVQYRSDTERGTHQTKLLRKEIERQNEILERGLNSGSASGDAPVAQARPPMPTVARPPILPALMKVNNQYEFENGTVFTLLERSEEKAGWLSTNLSLKIRHSDGTIATLNSNSGFPKFYLSADRTHALPDGFIEEEYLKANPDVAAAVLKGDFRSGNDHYQQFGIRESRPLTQVTAGEQDSQPPKSIEERVEILERLAALRASGAITDAEFESEKSKVI